MARSRRLLAVVLGSLICTACEEQEESPGVFELLSRWVEDRFYLDGLTVPSSAYAPGAIVRDEEVVAIPFGTEGCFRPIESLTQRTFEDARLGIVESFAASNSQAMTLSSAFLGDARLELAHGEESEIDVEVSFVHERLFEEGIRAAVLDGAFRESCRAYLNAGGEFVGTALRAEGLRFFHKSSKGGRIALDSGTALSEHVRVNGQLEWSAVHSGTLLPAAPTYVAFDRLKLVSPLPIVDEVPPPPSSAVPVADLPVEELSLWCCDQFEQPRCLLEQASPLKSPCACGPTGAGESPIGQICATPAPPPEEGAISVAVMQDPCAALIGGPLRVCGQTLSSEIDPRALYTCEGGLTTRIVQCETTCTSDTSGMFAFCEGEDPCVHAVRNGGACGRNLAPAPSAEPSTLHLCVDGTTQMEVACEQECVTGGEGQEDFCQVPAPVTPPGSSPPASGTGSGAPPA